MRYKNYYSYAEEYGYDLLGNSSFSYSGIDKANKILETINSNLIKANWHYQVSGDIKDGGIKIIASWQKCQIGMYKADFDIYISDKIIRTSRESLRLCSVLSKYCRILDELRKIDVYAYQSNKIQDDEIIGS